MISEDYLRLLVEVKGTQALADLKTELTSTAQDIENLKNQFAAGAITEQEFFDDTKPLIGQSRELKESIKFLEAGSIDTSKAMQNMGHVATELATGRIYGLMGSLQRLTEALGGPAGLGLAIGAASMAAFELFRNYDEIVDRFGMGATKTEAERMEELGKKTGKTADEAERYARWKAVTDKTIHLSEAKTESEKKSEDIATKTITETGLSTIVHGLIGTEEGQRLLATDTRVQEAQRRLKEAKEGGKTIMDQYGTSTRVAMPEEEKRAAVLAAEQALRDANEAAARNVTSAATITHLFTPQNLLDVINAHPEKFGSHVNYLTAGLMEAQRQSEITPEARQQEKVGKGLHKTLSGFLKSARERVQKTQEKINKDLKDAAERQYDVDAENERLKLEGFDPITGTTYKQRREARERKARAGGRAADANMNEFVREANAAEQAAERAEAHPVTGAQMAVQHLTGLVQAMSGGKLTEGQATGIARDLAGLQRRGLDAVSTQQAALMMIQASMAHDAQQYAMIQQQAESVIRTIRQINHERERVNRPGPMWAGGF